MDNKSWLVKDKIDSEQFILELEKKPSYLIFSFPHITNTFCVFIIQLQNCTDWLLFLDGRDSLAAVIFRGANWSERIGRAT